MNIILALEKNGKVEIEELKTEKSKLISRLVEVNRKLVAIQTHIEVANVGADNLFIDSPSNCTCNVQ